MKLWDLPLPELLEAWDEYDKGGTDLAGIRALALEDRFYLLVKVCRRHDALHPWIYDRCREVEKAPDNKLDLWAREHYKSTVITFAGVIQQILRDPEITCCIFSHTKGIARKFFRQIKIELESNEILKAAFPDVLWANPVRDAPRWSEETGLVVQRNSNPKEATLEAWGLVDGQPTSAHYKLRVYDDVVAPESVTTPEQIAKTTYSWELSDNLGTADGRKWHIGTRYHFGDTYEEILKRGALTPRIYAATDSGQPDGNPVLLTPEQWAEKKLIQGPSTIACQMLQNPIAGQQAMFDIRDLKYYEIRPSTLNIYVMCDPARSQKKDSANSAFAVLGVDSARNKYLLDGFNHKMNLKQRWESLSGLRKKWLNEPGVQGVYVGYEVYGAQADMDYFNERMEVESNAFEIIELAWPRDGLGSKEDRVQRLSPDIKSGKLHLPLKTAGVTSNQQKMIDSGYPYRIAKQLIRKDHEGNLYDLTHALVQQIQFFPFGGLKDLVDATSRIYDMDPRPPVIIEDSMLEPEATVD